MLRKNPVLLLLICGLLLSTGCETSTPPVVEREQILMGTTVSITIAGVDPDRADHAADRAFGEIRRLEAIMSTYRPDSGISKVNDAAGKGWTPVSPELRLVIRAGLRFGALSNGAFDITVKPLVRIWHIEKGPPPPGRGKIDAVLPLVDYRKVRIDRAGRVRLPKPGMAIVLGGVAKGYAVDRAIEVLEKEGIENAIVNAGGDLRAIGRRSVSRPWRVGIEDPRHRGRLMEELPLTDRAAATSGDYERFYIYQGVRYHHILDPRTGRPARGCRSVTVIAPTAMEADALATAVFVLGPKKGRVLLQRRDQVEGMIVDGEDRTFSTTGFPGGEK
ncbi:MAG: FAD:protein FMN transferase [Deltaproteobacteria bacterium]|nr:FAD:protein FMN transferase [Deltaproteobacteria bacterium]